METEIENTEEEENTLPLEKKTLTDWVNEPTINDLKQNLDDADIDHTEHQLNVDRWLDNLAVEGSARVPKIKGKSSVAPKVIRKHAEWRYSSLSLPFLSTPDVFNVAPTTSGDRKRAQQNALVLNNQFNHHINKQKFIDDYVRDTVDIGTVIVEIGWFTKEEEVTEDIDVFNYIPITDPEEGQQVAQQYIQLLQMKRDNQDLYNEYMNPGLDKAITLYAQTGKLYSPQKSGVETITRIKEVENHPTAEVCESANIIIDPSCYGDLAKAQFIGKKFKSSLSELKIDGRYENLDWVDVTSSDTLADPDFKESKDIESFSFKDEPRKQFVVHTYWGTWDIHNTGIAVPIVAAWVGRTLIRMAENPFPFKKPPFVSAVYMPVRRSVYGEPDGELLEENQQIIGATIRGMVDLMGKSANGQTGYRKGFMDATNKRKYKNGDDYEFNHQGRPTDAIYQHTYPEIPQSAYGMIQMQNADAESLSGVKAFASGINSQALGASVGGGRDAMDAASKREAGLLLRLASGIIEIGRMFIAMNAEWLSEQETVRVTNEKFVTVRRDDLAGMYDIALTISTPEEDAKRIEKLSFMLQTTGNNMDQGLQKIVLSDIARLQKMPALSKRIEEFEPQPDPLEQAKAQLEVKLLEAQIAKEEALTAKHQSEASANGAREFKDGAQGELNQAKVDTENAKGRNLHSDSDNKDIDYLKKYSGADHQEELDKENNKANNAAQIESIKALSNKNQKSKETK